MSTRGLFGWRLDGKIQAVYSSSDSYPSYVGIRVLEALQGLTREQILHFLNFKVKFYKTCNEGKIALDLLDEDWRNPSKGKLRCIEDSNFLHNAAFMEYAYIIDLDSKTPKLMVFTGFGKKPTKGWEHLISETEDMAPLWVNYAGSLDLALPVDVAYVLLHGLAYRHKRIGLLARCRRLVKMSAGDTLRESHMPELYDKYPDNSNKYSVAEAAEMLDRYLKYRLTHAKAA